jgi:hypothetical protein
MQHYSLSKNLLLIGIAIIGIFYANCKKDNNVNKNQAPPVKTVFDSLNKIEGKWVWEGYNIRRVFDSATYGFLNDTTFGITDTASILFPGNISDSLQVRSISVLKFYEHDSIAHCLKFAYYSDPGYTNISYEEYFYYYYLKDSLHYESSLSYSYAPLNDIFDFREAIKKL